MDCLPVRERLAEYALSNLPPDERAFVERHLQWCAGCRKEAAELASAAAVAGAALPQADPPAELEDRVVRAVRTAAGARPRRRRVRAVAVLVAATVAVLGLGVGWGASVVQNARHREHRAVVQAHRFATRLHGLINDVVPKPKAHVGPRDHLKEAQLAPTPGREGGGSAAVFLSPVRQDWALVVVGGLSARGAPFRVSMRDQYGTFAYVGTVKKLDSAGDATVWHEYEQHLDGFTDVIVKDRTGRIVLSGTIPPTPVATATP